MLNFPNTPGNNVITKFSAKLNVIPLNMLRLTSAPSQYALQWGMVHKKTSVKPENCLAT